VALGLVFSENFGFPCQSTFHLFLHNHNHLHYHPRLAQYARSGRSANSFTNQIKKPGWLPAQVKRITHNPQRTLQSEDQRFKPFQLMAMMMLIFADPSRFC
jgi:hypothetical protein